MLVYCVLVTSLLLLYLCFYTNIHFKKSRIKKLETLYVCELKYNENLKEDDETDILYAYASALEKNTSKQQKEAPKEDQTAETIQEKVKKTREKILEQREGKK